MSHNIGKQSVSGANMTRVIAEHSIKAASSLALQFTGETRILISNLVARVEYLEEQAKHYPEVAGKNIRLQEEVDQLKKKLLNSDKILEDVRTRTNDYTE